MIRVFTQFAQTITIATSDLNLNNAPKSLSSNTINAPLNTAYFLAGVVAVIVIIIGGIRYTTANGDSGKVQSAKNTILYAVIGLIVIIMATAATNFILTMSTK